MCYMQQQGILPEDHARFYSVKTRLAFGFLHVQGIIYRNFKLDNLFLDSKIKLTDYWLCQEGLQPGDKTSTFCGTPNYLALEILRGEDYCSSVDRWTLGVLFEMMVGKSPFHLVGSPDNPDYNTKNNLLQVILERKNSHPMLSVCICMLEGSWRVF